MADDTGQSAAARTHVTEEMVRNLKSTFRGDVYTRDDKEFKEFTKMFNGNVVTVASLVILPTDTADVSSAIKFCITHNLSPSVKAGGYGTAGCAINGDVVINLLKLDSCEIETPGADGSYIGLKDMLSTSSKGKEKVIGQLASSTAISLPGDQIAHQTGAPLVPSDRLRLGSSAKRRRSPDEDVKSPVEKDLPRNALVARFLSGSDRHVADAPAPSVRRRVDPMNNNVPTTPLKVATEHASRTPLFSEDATDPGRAMPHEKPNDPTKVAHPSNTNRIDEAEAEHSMTASTNINRSNNSKEEADAITAASHSTAHSLQAPSRASNSLPPSSISSGSHGRTSTQQSGRTSRGGSSLRTDDPFAYLSTSPSSLRSERDYVQQPVHRPEPHYMLQTGFHSMHPIAQPEREPSSQTSAAIPMGYTTTSLHQSFPYFMPSDAIPQYPCAFVTFGAGAKQKDIDLYTHSNALPAVDPNGHSCSIAYHVPFAAHPVGSSVMMLGGFGFLSRLHGLSIDALVEVEMVLADGSIIVANETEHADLWWALRGAGPAFGIATRYKAKAYPVPIVFAGNLIYNFNPATAASLIKHFRDCIKNAPRELYANVLFTAGPAEKGSLIVVQMCYIGAREKGQEFLQALSSWDGEACLLNEVSEKTFIHQQDSVAQILRGKAGRQWFIRSALITSLPDEIIHKTVTEFANTPVGCTWLVELAGGAVSDCETTCFPKSQREAAFTIVALHQWELDDDDPLCISTAEDWIHKTLGPVATAGPYPAFFGRHEPPDRIIGSYGENWSQLRDIKRKYDPNGLFRNCFWPFDKDGAVVDSRVREPPSPKLGQVDAVPTVLQPMKS